MSRNFTKDLTIVTISQFVGLGVSIIRSLILPFFLSVASYGYFQAFLLYSSITPLMSFGYNDGVYLRYGGYIYKELPFKTLSKSNVIYIISVAICATIAIIASILFVKDSNLVISLILSSIYGVINCINTLLLQIYQITSNFKKYSIFSISMRLLGLLAVSILLLLKIFDFKYFIIADIASLAIVTAILVYNNYALFKPQKNLLLSCNDYKKSINSGLPLLIANMMGILTIGVGRFIIQFGGGITDFAQYSFGMSIASLVSVAVASVSVVLYPMIKKIDKNSLSNLYNRIAYFLKISIIVVIPLYYVSILFIRLYYSKYSGLIEYLNILYAIIYIQTITSVLQNTYYKVLRQERRLFIENLISIIVLILIGIPTYAFFQNVISVAIVTLIAVSIRFFLSEKYLQKTLNLNNINFYPEFFLLLFFILVTYFFSTSVTLYLIIPCMIVYIFMKKDILASIFKIIIK